MKRIFVAIILVIYTLPAIGLYISVHYCGGEIASVSLGWEKSVKCPCGKKGKEIPGCCEDKDISIKLHDDQHKGESHVFDILRIYKTPIPQDFLTAFLNPHSNDQTIVPVEYPPPNPDSCPHWLRNRVLRI